MFADFIDQLINGYHQVHASYPTVIVMKQPVFDDMIKALIDHGDMDLSWAEMPTPNYKGIPVEFHDLEEVVLK